jgi:hypothetical protein
MNGKHYIRIREASKIRMRNKVMMVEMRLASRDQGNEQIVSELNNNKKKKA